MVIKPQKILNFHLIDLILNWFHIKGTFDQPEYMKNGPRKYENEASDEIESVCL